VLAGPLAGGIREAPASAPRHPNIEAFADARKLLDLALVSSAPAPLVAGARAILRTAPPIPVAQVAQDLLGYAETASDPAPIVRGAKALLDDFLAALFPKVEGVVGATEAEETRTA
jgi:hypothetical protein